METDLPKLVFALSNDARLLRGELRKIAVGDMITYVDLSKAVGFTVTGATQALQRAKNALLRSDDMVFAVIRSVGLKRLNDTEIVANGETSFSSIYRKARKGVRQLISVQDYSALKPGDQLRHSVQVSALSAITEMTTDRGLKRVESAVVASGSAKDLPLKQTLEAFLK